MIGAQKMKDRIRKRFRFVPPGLKMRHLHPLSIGVGFPPRFRATSRLGSLQGASPEPPTVVTLSQVIEGAFPVTQNPKHRSRSGSTDSGSVFRVSASSKGQAQRLASSHGPKGIPDN